MHEWEIAKSERVCRGCGRQFAELEEYVSALYEREGGFQRSDFCAACWRGPTDETFSFWKTQVPARQAKPRLFVDDDVLLDFFERLEGATDELKQNFRFILTLMLMRKRLVKFVGTRRDGSGEWMQVKVRGADQVKEVFNPGLTEEKIQQVTEEVGRILNVQL